MNQKFLSTLLVLPALGMLVVSAPCLADTEGIASWYGPGFSGNKTASGERFNPSELTAAHHSLPFGTQVQVTNIKNGRSVVVRVNDRPGHRGIVIDLSTAAAKVLGIINAGTAPVRLEVLGQ
ncbi:MAG: septal ring lytic transglycosylase RlpA family protein [Leptolyngbyaceae bacterium]|nr:septal ring lytic transglycosylase RlpA family protein [Leptolyngbyaceae bacterium]